MRELEYLDNKHLISLTEALGLEPIVSSEDYNIMFYINGLEDFVMQVEQTNSGAIPKVWTFSNIQDLRQPIYNLDSRDFYGQYFRDEIKASNSILKVIAGCWETVLYLKEASYARQGNS